MWAIWAPRIPPRFGIPKGVVRRPMPSLTPVGTSLVVRIFSTKGLLFFDEHGIAVLEGSYRQRDRFFCCRADRHWNEFSLVPNGTDHAKVKLKNSQTSDICEGFYKTALDGFTELHFERRSKWLE